ncbi:MAG: hypothetical protein NEHIOOID_01014 [Holosporales bacterium]
MKTKPLFKSNLIFWGVAALFYLYEVILRVAPSGITDALMESFNLTCTDLGFMVGAYYWSYTLLQIPCGYIVDKVGPRRVIALSALICALGTAIFVSADNVLIASIGRMLVGAGSACAFISSLKVATDWFDIKYFALFAGLTNMMGTLGGNFAGKPLAMLMNAYGWTFILNIFAGLGFVVAAMAFFLMKDKQNAQVENLAPLKTALSGIFKNKQIWLAGCVGGILYLPITAVAELWGVPFLMNTFKISNDQGSLATNLIFIGTALGSPVFAFIANRLNSYKKTLQLTAVSALILMVLVSYSIHFGLMWAYTFLFLLGFSIGGQVLAFSVAKDHVTDAQTGIAMGFTNALISFFGIVFQPLMGSLLDYGWKGALASNGIRLYDALAYQNAMLSIPVVIVVAMIMIQGIHSRESKI